MRNARKIALILLIVAIVVSTFSITIGAEASSEYIYGPNMTELERIIYNEFKANVCAVANGELKYTQFSIRVDASHFFCSDDELDKAASELDFGYIFNCLLAECPNELFWFDTKTGFGYSYSIKKSATEEHYVIYEVDLPVFADYRSATAADNYTVSLEQINRARQALSLAQSIVDEYADKSDFEKLKGYANQIAILNTYNTGALSSKTCGDPWQSVYVFDGDPDTNVVCAGYAKAFKYLCDLSTFDKEIYCFIVSGGNHMWNVVQINGENYYVDVTMADQPYGFNYDHFLAGGASSDNGRSFEIATMSGGMLSSLYYKHQENIHCEGYLVLSETYYHEHSYGASHDNSQHWLECFCGDRIEISPHTTTGSATCTQRTVCDVCNTEYGDCLPHTYDQQVITPEYLQTEATCKSAAIYYYSCECGAIGERTFYSGKLAEHSYDDTGICTVCGEIIETEPPLDDDQTINDNSDDDVQPKGLLELVLELLIEILRILFSWAYV